jgi:AcrR family transcriptional regulator
VSGTTEATRRRLTSRQADTVRRLTEAAVDEVREAGCDGLSIRDVARRAGVAAATAYTYFGSRDHLLAEIYWRRLSALPSVGDQAGSQASDRTGSRTSDQAGSRTGDQAGSGPRKSRVVAVLRELALLVSDEPELAAGCTAAMFGSEPDVRELRLQIGTRIRERIEAAAGRGPQARLLELAYFGAMVEAGLGYTTYERTADRLAEAAELIMR